MLSSVLSYPKNFVNYFLVPIIISCTQSFTKSLKQSLDHKQVEISGVIEWATNRD